MAVKKSITDVTPALSLQEEVLAPPKKRDTTKQSDGTSAGFCVYLGPSIRGVIQSGTVYHGSKAAVLIDIAPALERYPLIASLIIPGDTLAVDRIKVKTAGNLLNVNYRKLASGKK